jgi:hypothetical protein
METLEYKGYKIEIVQDESPLNPREDWDNLSTMICFHRRYSLGDRNHGYDSEDYNGWKEMEKAIIQKERPVVILPLYMYDHGGITISHTSFSCPWDSGQIGFIFVSRNRAVKEYGKRMTSKIQETIRKNVISEIEVYDDYVTGNVYGYRVLDEDGEKIDSCHGYFGYDHEKSGLLDDAKSHINYDIKEKNKVSTPKKVIQ